MTKPDKKIQGIDAIEFIGKIVDAVKFQHDHPCEKKKDGKDCADQDIPVSEFCDNCTKSWEKAAAIEGRPMTKFAMLATLKAAQLVLAARKDPADYRLPEVKAKNAQET